MKRVFFYAIGILAFVACSKEKESPLAEGQVKGNTVVITTDVSQVKSTEAGAVFSWADNETISVGTSDEEYVTFDIADKNAGTFQHTFSEAAPSLLVAVSPAQQNAAFVAAAQYKIEYPAVYNNYVQGTTNALMVGTPDPNTANRFIFRHVGALLKITYANVPVGTTSFVLEADENISGTVTLEGTSTSQIEINNQNADLNGSEVWINLPSAVQEANTTLSFYVPVPTGSYEMLMIHLEDANGSIAASEKTMDRSGKTPLTLARGDVFTFPTITLAPAPTLEDKVFFEERFGGSDSSLETGSGTLSTDNDSWSFTKEYAAGSGRHSARLGTGSAKGIATTPSIVIDSKYSGQTLKLSFKAAAWSGDQQSLSVSCTGTGVSLSGSDLVEGRVVTKDNEWTNYVLDINTTSSTESLTISFAGVQTSKARFFLDDVCVYYGAKPVVSSLSVSPSEDQEVAYTAGSSEYEVSYLVEGESNSNWSVATTSEGFSVEKNNQETGFIVNYTQNDGPTARTGVITVSAGNKTVEVKIKQGIKAWTDKLTAEIIGVGASYTAWDDIIDKTGVKYAGKSMKSNNNELQLNSSNPSGIVSTTTIGVIRKVVVNWGSSMTQARTIDIYGSDVAYTTSGDLYNSTTQGTKLGSISFTSSSNDETELTIEGDYPYVGVRSNSNAIYLDYIEFTYEENDPSKPRFGASVDGETNVDANVTSASIKVTGNVAWTASATNGATVNPASGTGAETITVTLPENTSITESASYIVTVSTSAEVSKKTYEFTFIQDKAVDPNAHDGSLEKPYTANEAYGLITNNEIPSGSVHVSGKVVSIKSTSVNSSGQITYFISEDGSTTNQIQVYNGKYIANTQFSSISDLAIGDVVVVSGALSYYNNQIAQINAGNYLTSINGKSKVLDSPTVTAVQVGLTKQVKVDWNTVTSATSYIVECGSDSYTAGEAETTHTFEVASYASYAVKVTAKAADAFDGTSSTVNVEVAAPSLGASIKSGETASDIPASGATRHITVTGNVAWTASITNGATLNPASGTGSAEIEVTIPKNDDTSNGVDYVFSISTDVAGVTNPSNITFSQLAKSGDPTFKYVKVTSDSDLTDGQYLIVYETNNVAFNGGLSSLDVASNTISITISSSEIAQSSTTDAASFTIDVSAGTIKSASNKYIGNTSNSNGLTGGDTSLTNTISLDNSGNAVIVSSGGAYLRYNANSGQERFRYFKSSTYSAQKAIQLYKRIAVN